MLLFSVYIYEILPCLSLSMSSSLSSSFNSLTLSISPTISPIPDEKLQGKHLSNKNNHKLNFHTMMTSVSIAWSGSKNCYPQPQDEMLDWVAPFQYMYDPTICKLKSASWRFFWLKKLYWFPLRLKHIRSNRMASFRPSITKWPKIANTLFLQNPSI